MSVVNGFEMFPEGFKKRISTQKYIDAEALLKSLQELSPVSIRINPLKWNRKPVDSISIPWASNGYYLSSRPSYTLDPLFHGGCYYPQEASSMFIEQAVRQNIIASEQMRVLDLCGAPGGKSTHLADLIGSRNLLIANDVIRSRASILSETLTKWGSGNVIVTQSDPAAFNRMEGYFNVVLVDAPCSGEGMFRTEIARSEWSETNTHHCSERQKRILLDIWPALKDNGILIYSTCTFNKSENEENIKWLTDRKEAESLKLDISRFVGVKEIDFEGITGYGFYPDKIMGEGFFISLIRKRKGNQHTKAGKSKVADLKPAKREVEAIKGWTKIGEEMLLKWGDDIWGLPCSLDEYSLLLQNLKIVKAGTRLCTVKQNDFLPAHDLSLSSNLYSNAFPVEELTYKDAVAFLRRDNLRIKPAVRGWNIVKYMGINLGWINNLASRLNNYYPVEWRIRMAALPEIESNLIKWD